MQNDPTFTSIEKLQVWEEDTERLIVSTINSGFQRADKMRNEIDRVREAHAHLLDEALEVNNTPVKKAKAYLFEWYPPECNWMMCAAVEGSPQYCEREIQHYAAQYSQDGAVRIRRRGYRKSDV